ncbi:MAG: NADH-quinone oxidoreductase subunit NuoH [Dehalococcoidia bacterium]|nr:NADH-quinone oxidoreductase subunit NuoH [Dehalococcoidia bacterium]MDD5493937.1 NADH-quinone oxidoreductase subunit NuoH [Dehalococcoidia bacterium]
MTLLDQFQLILKSQNWPDWAVYLVPALVGIIIIISVVLTVVIVYIWWERRLISRFQIRLGPNRCGPEGIFQPIATAVKILLKEDIVPEKADKLIHFIAPITVFVPILLIFAVVPFGEGAILADLNVGIVYVIAISSISVIGIFMAAWASGNKYSFISGMRSIAQMVSYEIPVVLSIVGIALVVGSFSMLKIVEAQNIPFILLQPLGFLIFFLGSLAEMNRSPFDLLEADSEIVAGYHIEYSGMKFAMFYLGEYGVALAYAGIITTLFLSGWQGPLLPPVIWFLIKVMMVFSVIVWIRSTLPRFRVDQLTAFAWKFMLPLAVINLVLIAIEVLVIPANLQWTMVLINFGFAAVLILLWSKLFTLGGGRVEV